MTLPKHLLDEALDACDPGERDALTEAFIAFFTGDDAGFDKAIEQFERAHDARVSR